MADRMERGNIFMGVMVAILILFSVTLVLAVVGGDDHRSADLWSFSVNNTPVWGNMYIGDDGTFYITSGKAIDAIGANGKIKWSLTIDRPGWDASSREDDLSYNNLLILNGASDANGTAYLVVAPSDLDSYSGNNGELLAISPEGQVLWSQPRSTFDSTGLSVVAGRVYMFSSHHIYLYDCSNGSLLWSIYSTFWPAVDVQGNLYLEQDEYENGQFVRAGVLKAYNPDGTTRWTRPLSDYGIDYREFRYGSLRALNDTLLVTDGSGMAALDYDGNLKWRKNTTRGAGIIDVDSAGRIYLWSWDQASNCPDFIIVGPDGSEKACNGPALAGAMGEYHGISDGVAYYTRVNNTVSNLTLDDLDTCVLSAYDLNDEKVLWTSEVSFSPRTVMLNLSSINGIMIGIQDAYRAYVDNNVTPDYQFLYLAQESPGIKNRSTVEVIAGDKAVYARYWAYNYEYPVTFDRSICKYAGGICAIDDNGKIIWSKQTDSSVTRMSEKNGTIYYRTSDGRFSAASVDMAAGFIAAAAYLFFRFFMLGAVSRARSRLDKNANRNGVLAFVAGNPGASLYEIAKVLGMNVGTVRYHLLILSINHKIAPTGNGPKSVGYFACSRLYSAEEKLLMSLMRRAQIRELLSILSGQPGASNADIAVELGLAESAVSRHMIELCRKGVVIKRRAENGKLTYCVDDRFHPALSLVFSGGNTGCSAKSSIQDMSVAEASR